MTNQQHPITPPPELLPQLEAKWLKGNVSVGDLLTDAYRAGADQELEACCEWLVRNYNYPGTDNPLRVARRPKPPSLKELALGALYAVATGADDTREFHQDLETIKQALESLPS